MGQDTVKRLIAKLQNMVERGNLYEARIAKTKLEALLDKYGLTIEDALDEQLEEFSYKVRDKYNRRILMQIFAMVRQSGGVAYWIQKGKPRTIWLKLTKAEHVEISELYDYYKKAFRKDIDDLHAAFIHKHRLLAPASGEGQSPSLEEMDKLMRLMRGINSETKQRGHGRIEHMGAN